MVRNKSYKNGRVMTATGKSYKNVDQVCVGEALAVKLGLETTLSMNMKRVILQSDCQGIVRMLQAKEVF